MEPDKRTDDQRGNDRAELLKKAQWMLQYHEPDDVTFVCAILAGHTLALCAEKDPEQFAKNIKMTRDLMYSTAESTFAEPGPLESAKAVS